MTTLISTAILLMTLAGNAPTAINPYGSGPADERMGALVTMIQTLSRGERDGIPRTVFVVPGPDLKPEGIAPLTEDLAVMCRIFDKATVWAGRTPTGEIGTPVPVDLAGVELDRGWVLTQSLYLDGYGAIFFLPVDFPLSGPPQEQAASKTEPAGDPLWSQTADELRGVPQDAAKPSDQQYDARKVENLKTALIGTLRHASNLRTRRPEDVITIVVASRTRQATTNERYGRLYGSAYGSMMGSGPAASTSASELPSVLILRTTKSDVDALAKGSLSLEQFGGKVQILKSWTRPNMETAPADAARLRLVVPQQNRW